MPYRHSNTRLVAAPSMSTFTRGSYVDVEKDHRTGQPDSEGGKAYIVNLNGGENRIYDVRYVIDNHQSSNVKSSRIRPATLGTTARRR